MSGGDISVTLQLELELEGDALRGRVVDAAGVEHSFTGRIGLAGLIEKMLDRPPEEAAANRPVARDQTG